MKVSNIITAFTAAAVIACALATAPRARAASEPVLAAAGRRIERACYRGDAGALAKLKAVLEARRSQASQPRKYVDYYLGYADYALAQLYVPSDKDEADDYIEQAEAALKNAIRADADFAEAHALLAAAYGIEISLHPFHGMWLGPSIGEHMDRATRLAPHNPRVTLIHAISDYYTPSAFGGNKQRAVKEFGQALEQFANYKPADSLAPSWGKAETYARRAAAEANAGDSAAARRDYRAALSLMPDYAQVRAALAKLTKNAPAA